MENKSIRWNQKLDKLSYRQIPSRENEEAFKVSDVLVLELPLFIKQFYLTGQNAL